MMWVQFENRTSGAAGRLRTGLAKAKVQADQIVRAGTVTTLVNVQADHAVGSIWMSRFSKEYKARVKAASRPESVLVALCGVQLSSERHLPLLDRDDGRVLAVHEINCNQCIRIRERDRLASPTPEPGVSTTAVQQDGGLAGMLSVLKVREDEALAIADTYAKASDALHGIISTEARLAELQTQLDKDREQFGLSASRKEKA